MCPSLRYWWQILLLSAYRLEQISAIEQRHFYAEVCGDVLCSFQHMEFDVGNDRLYVGGMNRIYQLRQDLRPEKTAETGPKLDSPECYPHSVCNYLTENTNNYNKLLIIDSDNDRLVACGSIKQGICDLRQLGNVTHVLNEFPPANDPRANDFVASMLPDQTTVAFMALEGRAGRERSLYVGSSRTEHDTKVISDDESFPTITSRRMPRRNKDPTMLSSELTSKQTTSHLTRKDLSSKTKDEKFRVNFVSAFDGDKTGYFVISYPQIADRVNKNKVKSYVSQVCMRGTDEKSTTNSYLEIPIASRTWVNGRESLLTRVITSTTAKVGSLLQNELGIDISVGSPNPDVLFVSFATEGDTASGSTLAMFPMYELDAEYYEMVRGCLNGHSMTHIGWLREGAIPCSKITFPIRRPLCDNNIWDIVGLYQGNRTKIGYTVYESKDTIVTSVAVAKQGKHTVAFMGTDDGQLLKLKIDSKPAGNRLLEPYEKVVIDTYDSKDNHRWKNMGSPSILPDMRLNNEFTRLFVMSERKLSSLPLHDCQKFTTCADCLNAGDPFCGWCTLLDRCAPATECEKGPNYYATSDSSSCPRLTGTNPAALHVSSQSEFIKVDIANIPNAIGGSYWCDFGDAGRTPATYRDTYVSCNSPLPSKVPNLNGKEIRLPLTLVYAAMGSNIEIAATEIVYYDCNYLSSCLQCLGSASYECHWCVGDNSCVRNGVLCKSYPGNLHNSEECPRLSEVVDPLYIHERKPQNVRLRVDNLGPIITSRPKFQCVFAIDGLPPKKINGSMLSREVSCGPITGFLPADKYEADARIDLYWGDNYLIDNPESLKVRMYRCSHGKGDSCGTCLLRDQDLHCGWCEAEKKCTLCDECTGKTCQSVSGGVYPGWLDEAQVCTHPEILKFTPESAAPGGRTTITIDGINFGRIFREDTEEVKVTVADEDCNIEKDGYQESSRIVCTVEDVGRTKNGPVSICLLSYTGECRGSDYRNSSQKFFNFVMPRLSSFAPQRGLGSGGSVITFAGDNLNIGNNVTVQIGDRDCDVVSGSMSKNGFKCKLACKGSSRTRRSHRRNGHEKNRRNPFYRQESSRRKRLRRNVMDAPVKVNFDYRVEVYPYRFVFENSLPTNLVLDRHESIQSGGMRFVVKGNNLDLTQKLMLQVSLDGRHKSRECDPPGSDSTFRICHSPSITGQRVGNYTAALIFDDCLTINVGVVRYTADPYLNDLGEGGNSVLSHTSGPIIITGRNLCPNPNNCDRYSAVVKIGDEHFCNVSALDKDKLVCIPPGDVTGKHNVEVSIGDYSQPVGSIQMESSVPPYLKFLIPIFIVLFVIIVVVAFVVWKRAGKKMEEVKEKQMRFDMMEAKVAQECREAFAELQTDMQSDLENIGMSGIPFRPRHDYIMRVLFPDPDMQDKLKSFTPSTPYTGQSRFNMRNGGRGDNLRMFNAAFEDFNQLLENKTFLIVFIHALEKQKKFTIRDRSNFAGLLMIVLQNRLEYATRILEELLDELIRDVIENGNPKLLLRRSESVAEKMLTHWFSILLHGFLQDCAGEHLFTLYRAIRAQLDKGPVDAITGFAKYSLNQDKLLRQAVHYEQLTLLVGDEDHPSRELPVRVLDCDTITQTKEKIIAMKYRNVKQSQHPSPDAFDLEMRSPTLGSVSLSDEDNTSIVEGGWRRLNTLQHYKVADKSVVTMVPRRRNQGNNSGQSVTSRIGGMTYNGSGSRLVNDGGASLPRHFGGQQDTRSSTPTQADDGKKPFHLMKNLDNEPRDGTGTGENMVSEIYFTRLLATKGTIQKFVNDLFETIFSVVQRGHALPLAIKHIYDYFDEQADRYRIADPDIVHTWKSNSLPLRFWVNLIKNPEFLFDIKKSPLVDSCLSVIAGAFMDSCSTTDQILSKDSPSGKLLYAKEVQNYKNWVVNYYNEISEMDHLGPQDMQCFLRDESMAHGRGSSIDQAALTELYGYVQKYSQEVSEALNSDPHARSLRLSQKLENLCSSMTSTV